MMNRVRVSAKTVDDAITEACMQLGLASTDIEYEVIEKGSAGFLGIGAKQAVIDVWKKSEAKPKKKEKVKEEVKEVKVEEKIEVEEKVEEIAEEVNEEKVEKLAEIEPQTKEACEKFLKDVLKSMGM